MTVPINRRLLAVVAHPDDETFGCGGTLAKYSEEDVRVSLVCATRGEAGEISHPDLATRDNLGDVREEELRAASKILGIQDLIILDYRDSGMAGSSDNNHPKALCQADKTILTGIIVEAIRRLRPQVLVTFDANGGYGHPDHIAIHLATVEAFHAAGDPSKFPDQISSDVLVHQPSKLYYFVMPLSMVQAINEAMAADGQEISPDFEKMGMPDEHITTTIDTTLVAKQKKNAALCHVTQISVGNTTDPFEWLPEDTKIRYLSNEFLVRAIPQSVPKTPGLENDLFADLS